MNRRKLAGLLVMALPALWAETEAGRGVARVSLTNGEITMQRGDSGDWMAAAVNAPLVSGDRLYAARASRAEVQFDQSNFLRLGEETEVRMAELDLNRYQVQVSKGVVTYRILRGSTAQVEINTPAVAVRPRENGVYRIEVLENGESQITVRDGAAEIYSSQGREALREGRTMIARTGPDGRVEVQVVRAEGRDDWDRWNERRDKDLASARSLRYAPPGVWGVDDLDNYGDWRYADDYGWCWFPRTVAAGWSPYSYGRWVWVDWYGWTWVGYEPWGWAPYHWGRWWRHPRWGWGWYPGPARVHSYWSPAVVGFFGFGSRSGFGFGVGFGYSNVGWVPLAPGEPFYPWWGRGYWGGGRRVYVDNSIHITNVTNIRNVYRNAGVNGGMVSVNTEDFARGRVVNPRRVSVAEVGNAGQIRGLVPVTPQPESLRVSDRAARAAPQTPGRDRFFVRQQPRAVERAPFQQQQAAVERSVRSAFEPGARRQGGVEAGAGAPAGTALRPAERPADTAVRPAEAQRGWRRFGEERPGPGVQSGPVQTPPAPPQVDRGFRRNREDGPAAAQPRVPAQPSVSGDAVVVRPQMDRSRGDAGGRNWRRLGDGQPPAATPSPAPQVIPQRDRGSDFRQMEQRRAEPPRQEPRGFESFRRSERQIELNRPIVVPRSRGGDGGGGRMSAPAPHQAPRGDGGGGRAGGGERGGGDHGGRGRR